MWHGRLGCGAAEFGLLDSTGETPVPQVMPMLQGTLMPQICVL
jgi:hypothetical protein